MCHIQPSPCLSAATRKNATLPLPTVRLSPCEVKYTCFNVLADAAYTLLSGMMVEVLGTVLGTAIQGQIVGGVSSCPAELNNTNSSNSTADIARVSLEETVSLFSLKMSKYR